MTVQEQQFQLLLSEKEFADTQIGGFFDLQVKVLAFLGAAVILLGWLYSEKPRVGEASKELAAVSSIEASTTTVVILLALVIIGCSVMLQGITMYGSSLAYLEYKMTKLNEEFRAALSLPQPPFSLLATWRSSPTQPPVALASISLFAMHVGVNVTLLSIAWRNAHGMALSIAVLVTAVYELLAIWAEVLVMYAFWKLMHRATNHEVPE